MGVLWLFYFYFLIEELSFLNALNCALKCMLALYFLCGIKKALRVMDLFFISNFQSLACKGKFMSFYTYWSIKGLIFVILWETPLICSWFIQTIWYTENSCHHFFQSFVAFYFNPFRIINAWSPMIDACLISYLMHFWNIIKNKVAALHVLFQTFFILTQEWIKMFLDDFVCVITNLNYA